MQRICFGSVQVIQFKLHKNLTSSLLKAVIWGIIGVLGLRCSPYSHYIAGWESGGKCLIAPPSSLIPTLPVWLVCRFQQSLQTNYEKTKQKENHFISTLCMARWKFMSVTLFNCSVGKIVCWWRRSSLFFPFQGLFLSLKRRCLLLLILWININNSSHIPRLSVINTCYIVLN